MSCISENGPVTPLSHDLKRQKVENTSVGKRKSSIASSFLPALAEYADEKDQECQSRNKKEGERQWADPEVGPGASSSCCGYLTISEGEGVVLAERIGMPS